MVRLNRGLLDSLNGLYGHSHNHDDHDENLPINDIDDITGENVWVATSRFRDRDGTQRNRSVAEIVA